MKTFNKAIMLIGTLALTSTAVMAQDNCDTPRNDFDGLYCLNKVYIESDKELNTAYRLLTKYLTSAQKSRLKRGQLAWMRQRNDRCSFYDDELGFFVNMDCATNTTVSRISFLNARLRECKAGSCRDSRLGN